MIKVPIEISARHLHLTQKHVEQLFGKGHELRPAKKLSQPDMFAAKETVTLIGPEGKFGEVRIVGPAREYSQVEFSVTDAFHLGLKPPVRLSGNIKNSEKITVKGPNGTIKLKEGAIIAARHLHCSPAKAKKYKLRQGQKLGLQINGDRKIIFHNVIVRTDYHFDWTIHLDTDEGNAALINKKNKYGFLIKK